MERKIKHACVALGAVIAAVTALLPLTSYAAPTAPDGKAIADSRNGKVSVVVNSSIQLEVFIKDDEETENNTTDKDKKTMNLRLEPNNTTTGTFTARVVTNKGYTLSLSAPEDGSVNLVSTSNNIIPGNGKVGVANTSGWGVKVSTSSDWRALPAALSNDAIFFTSTNPAVNADNDTDFNVGISIAGDIPQGIYQGAIVVTAANI